MSLTKNYKDYQSFQYLEKDKDYKSFELAQEVDRVNSTKVPLNEEQEKLVEKILRDHVLIIRKGEWQQALRD